MIDPELKRRLIETTDRMDRSREEDRRQWAVREQRLAESMQRLRARHEHARRLRRDYAVRIEMVSQLSQRTLGERLRSWWSGGP